MNVPTTTDKVPAAVEEVQASKAYWLKKRQEAKETGVMPEEPSSSLPNGLPKTPKGPKAKTNTAFSIDDEDAFPGMTSLLEAQVCLLKNVVQTSAEGCEVFIVEVLLMIDTCKVYQCLLGFSGYIDAPYRRVDNSNLGHP